MHKSTQIPFTLTIPFWIFILALLWLLTLTIRIISLLVLHEPKRCKKYKIKIKHVETNNIWQVKATLIFVVLFNFQNTIQEKYHRRFSVENVFLCATRADMKEYLFVECRISKCSQGNVPHRRMILLCFLISGNIHPNPGPRSTGHCCYLCKNDVCLGERVISCSTCNSWYHVACLSSSFQNSLKNSSAIWLCARCDTRNYSVDLLSQVISYFSSPNSFSSFTSTTTQEIHSRHSETPIANCGKARPLKLLTVNVNSLLAKRVELRQFLFDNSIDVMIACETKIDENVLDSELNLDEYDIYRNDRDTHGGGVIVAIKKCFRSYKLEMSNLFCELVCVKLLVESSKPVIICRYYRPPSANTEVMENLRSSLKQIQESESATLLLSGDFNLPSIDWETYTLKQNPAHQRESLLLLETIAELGLKQFVDFPTRGNNLLDLILTNKESGVGDVTSRPGVSDHEMLMYNFHVRIEKSLNRPRKIYHYHRADVDGLKAFIARALTGFTARLSTMNVSEQWDYFKEKLSQGLEKYIPSKIAKSKVSHPWVNRKIRREIRKRERLYKKAKKSGSQIDLQAFKSQKRRVRYLINKSHDEYVNNYVLCYSGIENKRFWKYIKSKKSHRLSIKCLIKNDQLYSKTSDILNAVNTTFYEAFIREDPDEDENQPGSEANDSPSIVPPMLDINITWQGVKKLIEGLNSGKSPGPDDMI